MAQNYTDSARGVLRSVNGQDYTFAPSYLRKRDPTSGDIKPKEQQGHYPVSSFWTNTSDQNVWVLGGIVNNLAKWILITDGGSGPLLNIGVPNGTSPIAADTNGLLNFTSTGGTVVITGTAGGVGAQDINFDIAGGTDAIESITGDDGVAVVPTTGNITLEGNVVANATHAKAVYVESPTAHIEKIDVQVAAAIASTNIANVGLASFDSGVFLTDANGFTTTSRLNQQGSVNLGIAETSGTTFTIQGASGAALSATNPAYVQLQSLATPGQINTYKITANQSFTQANISANTWGITSGVNWATDMPFYIYAVSNAQNGENTIAFMISRVPNRTLSPVAGNIGKAGSAVATTQSSFYCLPNVTVADYASSPCLNIGSFRMQYAASGTNWTIQTLTFTDGIGQFQEGLGFLMPAGQFGAASGKYFFNNGGTAPSWSLGNNAIYLLSKAGYLEMVFSAAGSNGIGAGAVHSVMALPFIPFLQQTYGSGFYYVNSGTTYSIMQGFNDAALPSSNSTAFITSSGTAGVLLNSTDASSNAIVAYLNFQINNLA
jgi:hypothetical protein